MHLLLIARAGPNRLGENRGVGGDPDDPTVRGQLGQLSRFYLRPTEIVQPDGDSGVGELLQCVDHDDLLCIDRIERGETSWSLCSVNRFQTLAGGAHHRFGGDVELLVDIGNLPGFAEHAHADKAPLQAEVAIPAHLHCGLDRHPG